MIYLAVALGGAVGALARFILSHILPEAWGHMPLPMMIVNVTGCFLMGVLASLMLTLWSPSPSLKAFLLPGLLGGFTTFSAFAWEFGLLTEQTHWKTAFLYVSLTVIFSLAAYVSAARLVRIWG